MRTSCGKCRRALVRSGWLCDRCHSTSASVCSICHKVVKGLFIWCQGCTHGGHLLHIRSWLRDNRLCPAGCGHTCEYWKEILNTIKVPTSIWTQIRNNCDFWSLSVDWFLFSYLREHIFSHILRFCAQTVFYFYLIGNGFSFLADIFF